MILSFSLINIPNIIDSITLYILVVLFLATFVRSAFGFGESLIAVPLLALYIPIEIAAPLSVLVSITVAGIVVVQDWKKVHVKSAGWLILSTLFGIPLGLLLLTSGNEQIVKICLAAIIIAFSIYSLIGKSPVTLKEDKLNWMLGCGFFAGILGGAYGLNGPPLVVYGSMRRWSAQHFRATLQGYFLPASIIGMIGYYIAGLWVPLVTHYYLISLTVVVPAIFLGRLLNHQLKGDSFFTYIYIGLLAIGVFFLIQSVK